MALVTFLTRIIPLILPKKLLGSPLFHAVNVGLPLAVMSLLILTSLAWFDKQQLSVSPLLLAQILALVMVLISYYLWKQLFVSMIIDIASLNGFLYVLTKI